MKEIDVLYFVEHTARELDVACVVKYLARKKYNLSIEIKSIVLGLDAVLVNFHPKVVALPYCTSVKDAGLEQIVMKWPEARYINLSFEQVLGETQKKFKAPKDDFSRKIVLYNAWGDFFKDYLSANGVPEAGAVVNGNPAYTLYQKPYRDVYGDTRACLAEKFNLDSQKRWVFVPENYGWAFFRDHMVRDRIRRGFDPEDAFKYRDFALDSLRSAARWWCDASKIETLELIVRPRPAIPRANFVQTIQEIVGEVPETLRVIKDGTVNKWILASDVVVSSYSTSLLEAAVAQKPLYMLAPIPFPDFIYSEWYELAENVESYEDFANAISQPQLPANWRALENWVTGKMMSQGDAIANLADTLFALTQEGKLSSSQRDFMQQFDRFNWDRAKRRMRKFGWDALQDFLALIGIQTADRNWVSHEQDEVLDAEVAQRVNKWAQVLG